jgi:peptide/nickel transport system permease protein
MSGVGNLKIIFRHFLPNIATIIIVESCFVFSGAIISEAGLSFLGIGIQAPHASLGIMLKQGMAYMLVSPHIILVPSLTLLTIVLMINLFSDKLTDIIAKH